MSFFDGRKTGDLISRLQADIESIEGALSSQTAQLVNSTLFIICCIGIFLYTSWEMTLFTLGIMVPIMCIIPPFGKFMSRIQKEVSDKRAMASDLC